MEIKDRLTQILSLKQMSPSTFADFLEIQRSNMSHYLSGRNKPGVEIVQKILEKFPDINANWLLSGRGEMSNEIPNDIFQNEYTHKTGNNPALQPPVLKKIVQNRKISKITVYFDDGTYQEFYSDNKK